jgi:PAS domain S-box-containing protein
MATENLKAPQAGIIRIVLIYALVGMLWIYASDSVLGLIVRDSGVMTEIAIFKGALFILLTSLLLYFLIRQYNDKLARSEQALRANEIYLRTILETEPECVKMLDADGNLLMMNRAGLDIIQADSLEQVRGRCLSPLIVESDREAFIALNSRVFQGEPGSLEFAAVGLKGRQVCLSTHAVPFRNEKDQIVALLAITRDITERKKSEILLGARIKLNEIAAETGLDAMLQVALDEAESLTESSIGFFHFMESDQSTLRLQAWSTNTLTNMCSAEGKGQHYPVDQAGVWVDCVRERRAVIHNDYRSLTHKKGLPEGHAPIVRELVVPIIRAGRIEAVIGVGNKVQDYTDQDVEMLRQYASTACDIAMRKQAEIALRESESRYRLLAENMSDVVWSLDLKSNRFTYVSPSVFKMRGYTPEEVIAAPWEEAVTASSWPDVQRWMTEKIGELRGGSLNNHAPLREIEQTCKDGSTVWTEVSTYYRLDEERTPVEIVGLSRDISERKRNEEERLRMEEQMLHVQKLESMGVLAGGIAHDFNNILTTIVGNADLALMRLAPESPVVEHLHHIEKAAGRASDLAKQMLAYSGKGRFVIESIDLNRLIEEMLHMLEVSISKKSILRLDLHRPLPTVDGDATQLRQIIMNLVINASEAVGDKSGVISITTGCMQCDRNYLKDVWLDENLSDGLYVFVEIADSGCGMDKGTMKRIFDPFFTTKFAGRGLGMAAVLGIVRGHKGAIKVYSEPGKGSSFKLLIPAENRPLELFDPEGGDVVWQGSGTVLLVDDEETIRALGQEMLQELGFQVEVAEDGRHALEIYRRGDTAFSLVILDLTMPHMDGEQTLRELRRLDPGVKIVISSGYNEHEVTQKFLGKGLSGFIQKPYTLLDLKNVLKNLGLRGEGSLRP